MENKNLNIMDLSVADMDLSLINDIEFEDIDYSDYPDFCDAYIVEAYYDGVKMTPDQIEELNEDREFVYERLWAYLY